MRNELTLSPSSPGAGRFVDYIWPDPETYITNSQGRLRNFDYNVLVAPTFPAFGGGTDVSIQVRQGALSSGFGCNAGGAGVGRGALFFPARVPLVTSRSAAGNGAYNDLACWRLMWIAAFFTAPQPTGEVTCACIVNQGITNYIAALADGFGFHYRSDGRVSLAAVRGGVLTEFIVTPVGFDITLFHIYEMRLTAATAGTDAGLQVLIDNAPVALPAVLASWAAGTGLPSVQNVGGGPGFLPMLRMVSDSVNGIFLHQFRASAGPTPASLL